MSLINRALNRLAQWALERGAGIDPANSDTVGPRVWAYTIKDPDGSPYLTRVIFPRVFGYRPMLHRFHRPDGDRALHNHPWKVAYSIILRGSYTEERRLDPEDLRDSDAQRTYVRHVWLFNKLTDRDFHRVRALLGDEVWTLFIAGPRVQSWGFLDDDDNFTDWREYIAARELEAKQRKERAEAPKLRDTDELDQLTGAALDQYAEHDLDMRRSITYKLQGAVSVVDTIESDDAFRAQIKSALLGGMRGE